MTGSPDYIDFVRSNPTTRPRSVARQGFPFDGLFHGWVAMLSEQVAHSPLITEAAHADRATWLTAQLCGASASVLQSAFEVYIARRTTAIAQTLAAAVAPDSTTDLDAFLDDVWDDGVTTLADAFPGWIPRVDSLAANWLASCRELDGRLCSDIREIERELIGHPVGAVTRLSSGLGDPHHGGRTVSLLFFESGDIVVYKPRSLAGEAAFAALVGWASTLDPTLPLPAAVTVIDRDAYGWMSFVSHRPCRTAEEVAQYYRNSGGLLALVFALCGTDCHHENIISDGPTPVLVDAETLVSPLLEPTRDDLDRSASAEARRILRNSVLQTGLLPSWHELPTGDGYDSAGFGAADDREVMVLRPGWEHVNTDYQCRTSGSTHVRPLANVPRLGDTPIGADEHVEDIVAGFEGVCDALQRHRDTLLAADGPIQAFRHLRTRLILRPTQLYSDIRTTSIEPAAVADPDRYFEHLLKRGATAGVGTEWRGLHQRHEDLVRSELDSLRQLDIPRIEVRADDATVVRPDELRGRDVGARTPGFNRVEGRIRDLSVHGRRVQGSIINASFYCRAIVRSSALAGDGHDRRGEGPHSVADPPLEHEELRWWVRAIASRISELAIHGADGSACWIVPTASRMHSVPQLRPMDSSVYGGTGGVALFLAAASLVLDEAELASLARSALRPLVCSALPTHLGGYTGIGSAIYTLVTVGDLLGDESMLVRALRLADTIERETIRADTVLDLVGGSAGLALALTKLARSRATATAYDKAMVCCDRLATVITSASIESGDYLAGLGHGLSGYVVAMSRLQQLTGAHVYDDAIDRALAAEHNAFDDRLGNWLDFRDDAPDGSAMVAWCSGAPGVGFARLALGDWSARCRADLDVAIETTTRAALGGRDHLCCGTFGRSAFLFEAGRRRGNQDLCDLALRVASTALRRAGKPGRLCFVQGRRSQADHLGMFQGTTGIGWQLLRMIAPELVPELLLLD